MTQAEFEAMDFEDNQLAWEVWYSMTEEERDRCTPERMNNYIADTYLAIAEMEE